MEKEVDKKFKVIVAEYEDNGSVLHKFENNHESLKHEVL